MTCARLLKQGGRTCQRLPDGDKKVCSDPLVAPTWASCLVYSFGLGHDFTFDVAMAQLGCEVFVFDDDQYHDIYNNHPFIRIHFGHVRLGTKVLYQVVEDKVRNSTYAYMYRPLDNLMYLLGHTRASINLLKMDIEGDEWKVFNESIFKTDILARVGQLAIEIHMTDFLKPNITAEETVTALYKYIAFFTTLRSRGFRLAYYEPNYMSPTFATVAGITFSILAEQLWINTLFRPPPRRLYSNTRAYKAVEYILLLFLHNMSWPPRLPHRRRRCWLPSLRHALLGWQVTRWQLLTSHAPLTRCCW
uniref:Methyltransferase domain-containing protein n=1 Tax=Scylla olivacea TaxID=85551 RepID=A0A0N7ZAW1_SCYOL